MISIVLLIAFVSTAAVTDIWSHKVFNWTTYPGIGCAFLVSVVASLLGGESAAANTVQQTRSAAGSWFNARLFSEVMIGESIAGFLFCGFVLLVCFVLFNVGGGDVKLIAMIGAYMGIEKGIEALLWTFVLGGATGLIVLIWKIGVFRFVRRVLQIVLWKVRLGGWGPLKEEEREQLKMPLFLAPNALLAVLIVQFSLLERLLGE